MTASAAIGVFGKLPVRGDFVQSGLPASFVRPWDDWLQQAVGGSRTLLGEAWLGVWLEAPVWRFALPAGMCGASAVLGLFLPSVDRVGRYFPLTLAAVFAPGQAAPAAAQAEAWLDGCEQAGRAALEQDATVEQVMARVPQALPPPGRREDAATWWTAGGPRVPPTRLHLPALPDTNRFVGMLGAVPGAMPGKDAP